VCACLYSDDSFRHKRNLRWIFGTLIHLDPTWVRCVGQGHSSRSPEENVPFRLKVKVKLENHVIRGAILLADVEEKQI